MRTRRRSLALVALAGVTGLVLFGWWQLAPPQRRPAVVPVTRAPAAPQPTAPGAESARGAAPRPVAPRTAAPAPDAESEDGAPADDPTAADEDMHDAIAEAWARVDLDEVRRAMPDNLYFKLSVPTQDETVAAERAAERARWNVLYGKMLSGTGTDDEIRSYYDQRARLSSDYLEFTTYLLDHYRDTLPERDVGLLELARRLHAARLQEMPRQVEEAFARKRRQDAARAAWLAGEAAFANGEPAAP